MDLFETHIALASEIEICVLTHSDMPYTALKKGEMKKKRTKKIPLSTFILYHHHHLVAHTKRKK